MAQQDARRSLPAVDKVVERLAEAQGASQMLPHPLLVDCARRAVEVARIRAEQGEVVDADAVVAAARGDAEALRSSLLRRVVNATGVLIHTNLGRSPLDAGSLSCAFEIASGFSNLEYRLAEGSRGSRHEHAGSLLARACGAEAGIVVNNNAAAVLVTLAALARGREVVVSRGELVEIGGGFRVPEVMAESGARLVEVGTTNRTRVADYEAAVGSDTALLLKVHASNYRMVGFVQSTPVAELARVGPPVVFDAGSGLLDATTPWLPDRPGWLADEPGVRQAIEEGAALVTFSGDKLLGGPQAGVIVGRRDLVEVVAGHPLARAVRADKLTLAALQAVALTYLSARADVLPLWRMAAVPVEALRERAARVAAAVRDAVVVDTEAVVGGGSLPGRTLPSVGVTVRAVGPRADAVARVLRVRGVVARVERDAVVCDLRTVDPAEDDVLTEALRAAVSEVAGEGH